jgi:hypothetical protein
VIGPNVIGPNINVTSLAYTQSGGRLTIYAGVSLDAGIPVEDVNTNPTGIWRSSNGGATWQHLGVDGVGGVVGLGAPVPGSAGLGRISLTTSDGKVFAAVSTTNDTLKGVYQTTDGGNSWTTTRPLAPNFLKNNGQYTLAIGAAGRQIYLGGTPNPTTKTAGVYVLNSAGKWQSLDKGANNVAPHWDFHAFAFGPDGRVYAATDGGVYRYNPVPAPATGNWDDLNSTGGGALSTLEVNSVALNSKNSNILLAGSQDNGTGITTDAGANWKQTYPGDGETVRFYPKSPDRAFGVSQYGVFSSSGDGGQTWIRRDPPGAGDSTKYPFSAAFAIDPNYAYRIVIASKTMVYLSIDSGTAWLERSRPFAGTITALAYAPNFPDVLYIGFANGNVVRSDHAYANATIPNWMVQGNAGGSVTSIVVDPADPNHAFASLGSPGDGRVVETTDGGRTWTPRGTVARGLPPLAVNTLVLGAAGAEPTLYAGTDAGVYRGHRDRLGVWTWLPSDTGLPNVQVADLQMQTYGMNRVLAAATRSRGVWTLTTGAAAAALNSLTPATGPTSGGTYVTITGSNLDEVTEVDFGGIPATFTLQSDRTILAVSPENVAGPVDVTLVDDFGTSATSSADVFTYVGSSVIVTASGTGTPTGSVSFEQNGTVIGTGTLSPGYYPGQAQATFTTANLPLGNSDIVALYNGDTNDDPSISPDLIETVEQLASSVLVSSDTNPAALDQPVTISAMVFGSDGGIPTGSVLFEDDGTPLGSSTLDSTGTATFVTSDLSVGTRDLTVVYAGDSDYLGSSGDLNQTIVYSSVVTLNSDVNPAVVGQLVTFTATVTPLDGVTPTGTVSLYDDKTLLDTEPVEATAAGEGTAAFDTSTLPVGDDPLTAVYNGDSIHAAGDSAALVETVDPLTSSVFLTADNNPLAVGQSVTFTAFVNTNNGGTPTGSVTFTADGVEVGTAALTTVNGEQQATFSTSALTLGDHDISATYLGDAIYPGSSDDLTESVVPVTTKVTLSADSDPSMIGQSVTFTAWVSASDTGTPTGNITFEDNGTLLATVALNPVMGGGQAIFTTSGLTLGYHFITADYSGDTTYPGSSANLVQTVNLLSTLVDLSSSVNPSGPGQAVTFTADVYGMSSFTPTGKVAFYDGTTWLDTERVTPGTYSGEGQASFTTSSLALGSHSITAVYSGDNTFSGSTSYPFMQNVQIQLVSTSTTVSTSLNPASPRQMVTFTAYVAGMSSATPTGTVTFFEDGTAIDSEGVGPGTYTGQGQASFTTFGMTLGNHTITATYSGDSTFSGSNSTPITETIQQPTFNIWVSSDINPSAPGQAVTFTADVSAPTGGTPTGTVDFLDGSTSVAWATLGPSGYIGQAQGSFTTADLTLGSHDITAVYYDGIYAVAISNPWTQTVQQPSSSTALFSNLNPSAPGQAVTFTAVVSGTSSLTPTGTVIFFDGTTAIDRETVSPGTSSGQAQASFTTSSLTVGSHSITAVYIGDGTFTGSSSSPLTQTVQQPGTAVSLWSSLNPSVPGQAVTFTADVLATSGGTPSGSVTYYEDGMPIDTESVRLTPNPALVQADFTTSALTLGSHTITAVYNGNSTFGSNTSSPLIQIVQSQQSATSTWLSSSNDPSAPGQAVTFTANVSAMSSGTPTGTVTFFEDGNPIDIETVSPGMYGGQGQASFTTSNLTAGSHSITAVYSGDNVFSGSTSYPFTQTVQQNSSSLWVSSDINPSAPGQAVTFTAYVSGMSGTTPTGTVTFYEDGTSIGIATLSPGVYTGQAQATFTTSGLTLGSHTITAVYGGDSAFAGSSSYPLTQTVQLQPTWTSLSADYNVATLGQAVTFTAYVGPTGTNAPTGIVTFYDNGTLLGVADLVFGMMGPQATLTTSSLTLGNHTITADYSGDSNDAPSNAWLIETVNS